MPATLSFCSALYMVLMMIYWGKEDEIKWDK